MKMESINTKWLTEDELEMFLVAEKGEPLFTVLQRLAAERDCGFHMSAEFDRLEERNRKLVEAATILQTEIGKSHGDSCFWCNHAAALLAKNGSKP